MNPADFTAPPALPAGLPEGSVVVSVIVPNARDMNAARLTAATREAYEELRHRLHALGAAHLVRVWNYVPALLAPAGAELNRYMAFNAGRFEAMSRWFGEAGLAKHAPAGTGVGAPGDDLILHGMGTTTPGEAIQNPRQTPAVQYSARYGPRPPCFARATRVGRVLLVSGTAAITGEDTVAPDDLPQQLALTLDHLAALAGDLRAYRSVRVYVPRQEDVAAVIDHVSPRLPNAGDIRPVVTDLCRPELRVEIEGIADDSTRS